MIKLREFFFWKMSDLKGFFGEGADGKNVETNPLEQHLSWNKIFICLQAAHIISRLWGQESHITLPTPPINKKKKK